MTKPCWRTATACLVAAATAALAVGCGSSSPSGSTSPGESPSTTAGSGLPKSIDITYIGDLTGPVGFSGKALRQGMQLAVDEAREQGLLGDSKVVLTTHDTGSNQGTATSLAGRAVRSDTTAIIGPGITNETLAMVPFAQKAGVPFVATISAGPGVVETGDYIYRLNGSQLGYDHLVAEYLREKDIKSTAIISVTDNVILKVAGTQLFPSLFKKDGIDVVTSDAVPTAQTDFSTLISKVVAAKPDAVGVLMVGAQNASMVAGLRRAGYKGLIWGGNGMTAGILTAAGPAAEGVVYPVDYTAESPYPSSKQFTAAFKKRFGATPNTFNADGYDAMRFLLLSLQKAGSTDHRTLLEKGMQVVAKSGFDGAVGPVKFTGPGDRDVTVPGVLVEWRDGAEHLIKPGA